MPSSPPPAVHPAVVDLLGALAYGQLSAFTEVAADAALAPLSRRVAVGRLATGLFGSFDVVRTRLEALGVTVEDVMEPFVEPIDRYHERTSPQDWLEGLVKAYVGDGIARDFFREVAAYVDPDTRSFIESILGDHGQAAYIVTSVREAIAADPRLASRLSLWARRLVGEALQQAQHVAGERDTLITLVVSGEGGAGLTELGEMFARVTDAHTSRMERLGLTP